MSWSIIIMCICAFVLAYYTSGMLVTIAMEKWVYQFSIDVMTGYVRREVELNDGVNAEGLFELDDIVVMLIPPVGDIVYNPLI